MNTVRFPLLRGSLLLIALAAMAFILARGDSPAAATTYNPGFAVSVSDPNPGAAADIQINFSVDAPDAFPNVKTNSSIQFIPRQWGVHTPESDGANAAPPGSVAGTFNALTNLGIFGNGPCLYTIPVPFTMMDASPYTGYDAATGAYDPQKLTSAMDIGGGVHPGGPGYSGQFVKDPATVQPPGDLGLSLFPFSADEGWAGENTQTRFNYPWTTAYRDVDHSGMVSVGDIRLTGFYFNGSFLTPGTVVQADDLDMVLFYGEFTLLDPHLKPFPANQMHTESVAANGQADIGEGPYDDVDGNGKVSYGDIRRFDFLTIPVTLDSPYSIVSEGYLVGGVTHYPDFLNQMLPPSVVGEPLARQWGGLQVITTAVSLNIVTYRPGQLPGYPATLGYPNIVILLNPAAPVEYYAIETTSDLCTPLSLTSTNLGISKDNPTTLANEGGYVRLTNPKAEKSHDFTLVTTSQPDADNDGIENMLDSCPLDANTQDLDGRSASLQGNPVPGDPDVDELDGACDPDPNVQSPGSSRGRSDEDLDSYSNLADNCATTPNGVQILDTAYEQVPGFTFFWAITGDPIGPSNQIDSDGDDIGDACEGAETGAQCANDADDDADGAVNDGCPSPVYEHGAQCLNDTDDDGDGKVNDGCPRITGVAESGAQCANATDDDGDGWVNEGCPKVSGTAESGAQCTNNTDDDGDTLVNDGCPTVSNAESGAQCSNALDDDGDGKVNDGCAQFPATNNESGAQCSNALDDDFDGFVNDGCAQFPGTNAESGAQCSNATDDDFDGFVNDGCPRVGAASETVAQCSNALDDDGDGVVNDGCAGKSNAETVAQCANALDDDGDGVVNDGCAGKSNAETVAQCANDLDDDGDGVVNDGCPRAPAPAYENAETGPKCSNAVDDDFDGVVNDGCPINGVGRESGTQCDNAVDDDNDGFVNDGCADYGWGYEFGAACDNAVDDDHDGAVNDSCLAVVNPTAETGAQCTNNTDDDADGLVNDGCESVDPGNVAKTTITGHMHVVTLTQGVAIAKHGIKLDDLDGKEKVDAGGSANYKVSLENKGGSAEDFPVAVRVIGGCGTVSGPATVHVNGDASANANFTVDFSGCAAGEYTVQADACHAGDPAPAGLFGEGACPGASDGLVDTNQLDDAPRSVTVVVGSP